VKKILHLAGDPRSEEISGFRAYSLGLNIRGRSALQHWPGLWERIAEKVVVFYRRFFLVGRCAGRLPNDKKKKKACLFSHETPEMDEKMLLQT